MKKSDKSEYPVILAIESSCDDTSAAVISNGKVQSNIISSQLIHSQYGGVIPELASRAHLQAVGTTVRAALERAKINIQDIDAVAVTTSPGLAGSLIVGSHFAKGLAIRYGLPIIPINHIEGHLYSGCLEDDSLEFPFIALVASGGHTALFYTESYEKYTLLGSTIDDAAGEAFDKTAKLLGLGYPGGPEIDRLAKQGNPAKFIFPRSMMHDGTYNFSFSGFKTSIRYFIEREFPNGVPQEILPDICASAQEAVAEVLVAKTMRATKEKNADAIVVSGGVSANSRLREIFAEKASKTGTKLVIPRMSYCVDNAAMIGFAAARKLIEYGTEAFRDYTFCVSSSALRAERKH
ncbi:tRNA (adenosine(37)-N6)-threonylcarbamoyltransferase complex transferase subunit TsaD [Ignavibacteria bacterium]|nr:tRNA (adenosine(37)-N6)-threonylcarbamoyltransferase complex transferase subunit TsaD [Bacteroidota bacterium]MCZ2133048.1 tRNA (adenosine(37)-N6)-threonylcarbamoyltransferase complex transferase subunit TsaD [Bacteroidota bacterium]